MYIVHLSHTSISVYSINARQGLKSIKTGKEGPEKWGREKGVYVSHVLIFTTPFRIFYSLFPDFLHPFSPIFYLGTPPLTVVKQQCRS